MSGLELQMLNAVCRTALVLSSALVALLLVAPTARGQEGPQDSVKALFVQDSMNVFRRFVPEHREKMVEFYGTALALKSLSPVSLGNGAQMILFGVGTGQLKLASGLPRGRQYRPGAVQEATGLRLITLFFPDEAALTARFTRLGYPAPRFQSGHGGTRVSHVADPGGFMIELVVVPNAPAATYDRMEVGITVTDLERSHAFYRDFVGLEELPAVQDPVLGVTKYPYRHGETTVNLWTFGTGLPADTGSAGIQYVVGDVDTVDAQGKARNVTIETPLANTMPGLRTVWLNDPDGVTNYFAQVLSRRR